MLISFYRSSVTESYHFSSPSFPSLDSHHRTQTFTMSSWERCAVALGSYHFVPHIVLVAAYVLLEALPSRKAKKV